MFAQGEQFIHMHQANGKPAVTDGRQSLEVPPDFVQQIAWVLQQQSFRDAELAAAFPKMPDAARKSLVKTLKSMQVVS